MKKIYSKPAANVVDVVVGSMMQQTSSLSMEGVTNVQLSKRLDFLPEEEFEDEEW